MDVSEAKRLKALEDENVRLKKLLAEQMLVRRRCASSCQTQLKHLISDNSAISMG